VAFSNQSYTAPSIPKLSKKTISSPLIRGASKISATSSAPRLKISRSSFKKNSPLGDDSLINTVVDQTQSIDETNRILVEIQKQLALDFAYRIAEERDFIKQLKKQESKRKFEKEESRLETTGKKITGAVGGVFNKITQPVKGVFDKILEFFSLIATGILLNKAFAWLQDKGNREKLFKVFDFIGKAFVPFIIGIVSLKVVSIIAKTISLAAKLFSIGKKILGLGGKGIKPPRAGGPGGGNLCNQIAQCFGNPAVVTSIAANLSKVMAVGGAGAIAGLAKGIQPPQLPQIPQGILDGMSSDASAAWNNAVGLLTLFAPLLKSVGEGILGGNSRGGTIPGTIAQGKKCDACSLGFSSGGTIPGYNDGGSVWQRITGSVGGFGSGVVDSVKALLAPGEEVIRTSSAMLFRPLLKDINDNAGRLWSNFSLAVNKLGSVTAYQEDVSDEFYKTIQELDKNLKDDILRRKVTAIGGVAMGTRGTTRAQVKPSPKRTNIPMKSKRSGGMAFMPFTLPTQKSAPPQMPQIKSGQETESPQVSSVNTLDPYVMTTAEKYYGIFVG
jgi:hypothetical protein